MSDAVVAEVVRSGFVEGRHRGSVVALAADGSVDWSVGPVDQPILPRSCNKPIQATAMVRAGLDLPPDLLALTAASHSGEPFHVEGVRRILASAGLDETALQTPPDWPLDDRERDEQLRAGAEKSSILMNCSGKHAAMLATCVVNAWDPATYLKRDHPLQVAIRTTFEELTGETAYLATDGCGAPLLSASPVGLAGAFRRLALGVDGRGEPDLAAAAVADAIRRHPEMVSGSRRDERALLTAMPGAIGKAGAEACYVVALPDGRAFALKIDDGGWRARPVVMAAALRRAGVDAEDWVDANELRRTGEAPLHGGGEVVGEVRASI